MMTHLISPLKSTLQRRKGSSTVNINPPALKASPEEWSAASLTSKVESVSPSCWKENLHRSTFNFDKRHTFRFHSNQTSAVPSALRSMTNEKTDPLSSTQLKDTPSLFAVSQDGSLSLGCSSRISASVGSKPRSPGSGAPERSC